MSGKTSAEVKENPYALTKPCARCPFRTDIDFLLRPGRAREFATQIKGGWEFPCHKTTLHEEDEDGGTYTTTGPKTKACAGALLVQRNEGRPNQMTRIAERLGMLNLDDLRDAPVFSSLAEFVRVRGGGSDVPTAKDPLTGEEVEYEHCGVVGDDCEDPAGYSLGGDAMENDDPPTCNPFETCSSCGNPMCSACRAEPVDGYLRCIYCTEDEED